MADDLKLIELVFAKPKLWDSRIDDYKLSERKSISWVWIADQLASSAGTYVVAHVC